MRKALFVGVIGIASACANNVSMSKSTGPDGSPKGAKPIVLQEGTGTARDIVTYPGGDRVDWKVIEIPEGKKGTLDLTMTYSTPRPGLRVAFDVFDQWNVPVFVASTKKPERTMSIDKAKGKYFVRVYAPRRKDAATYKLKAEFHEQIEKGPFCYTCLAVADPPKLPEVPEVADPVPPPPPPPPQPPGGTGTGGPTPPPPPPPPVVAKPVTLRVIKYSQEGDSLEITYGGGSETSGISKEWKATVLQGETDKPLVGAGGATIVRVTKTTTVVRVKITSQLLGANSNIRLAPP